MKSSDGARAFLHEVVLTDDAPVTGVDFGNSYGFDFGDAPAPYPTLQANNGPSHGLIEGFHMGNTVDTELDGNPTGTLALGDGFDEDGVTFSSMFAGTTSSVVVDISNAGVGAGLLYAQQPKGRVELRSSGLGDRKGY